MSFFFWFSFRGFFPSSPRPPPPLRGWGSRFFSSLFFFSFGTSELTLSLLSLSLCAHLLPSADTHTKNEKKKKNRYIAMQASMASGVVDICLIPEVPFTIPKLCAAVEAVLDRQGHCVVCVAEGAGQDLARTSGFGAGGNGNGNGAAAHGAGTDASGNPILEDVGAFLKSAFKQGVPGCDCKYIGELLFFCYGETGRERQRETFEFKLFQTGARARKKKTQKACR